MGSEKLTKARRRALEWYRDNDGAKFFPVSFSRRTVDSLVACGLLKAERPPFGFVRHSLTAAGRDALREATDET